ncbi:hypothetical protein A3K82_02615 [Candidatus Pacearchaeota archaeon RBG_19FT_COMBO_34_9]|nr:MAG: hypothetical protein A3K82_02615 [Candidatus Pacearchaeota archaeon RBG_19FT_COMBO_34_9]OGJ15941.1 MAG: hypothetical protein A3K74_02485 [Candidatus Pacearchaeota archaeon RBG_13_33_26]
MRGILKTINALRRRIMQLINNNYIKNKLAKRRGKCRKCGKCCRHCKFLNRETKLCKVYKKSPWNCHKDFPLDKLDQKIWNIKDCGYSFIE